MLYVRGNFFIPDARIGWVKPSVSFLLDYIKKEIARKKADLKKEIEGYVTSIIFLLKYADSSIAIWVIA